MNRKYEHEIVDKHIKSVKDIDFLQIEDMFEVTWGNWLGRIDSRNENGITITMFDSWNENTPVRKNVFISNDEVLDIFIHRVYKKIPLEDIIKKHYESLCKEFGEVQVNRTLHNMYKEIQIQKTMEGI